MVFVSQFACVLSRFLTAPLQCVKVSTFLCLQSKHLQAAGGFCKDSCRRFIVRIVQSPIS